MQMYRTKNKIIPSKQIRPKNALLTEVSVSRPTLLTQFGSLVHSGSKWYKAYLNMKLWLTPFKHKIWPVGQDKNIMLTSISKQIAWLFLFAGLLMNACDTDNNHPGYVYFPDMDESRAYDTYSENPNFEDSKTMREPVEGTRPRGFTPYPLQKNDTDLVKAGNMFTNPLVNKPENIHEGKELYARFCLQCHGEQGDGQGILYTSGRYPYPPSNLLEERAQNRSEGEIYHIISVGWGIMGAHAPMILPEERWQIIMYVQEVLQDTLQ